MCTKEESMSNVKIKDIPFMERYVKLVIEGDVHRGTIVANLRCLYEFIGKNSPGNPQYEFGNACRVILKRARNLAGYRKYIISKRQVIELVEGHCDNRNDEIVEYIKIPYASDYIFRAIFDIFEEYKNEGVISIPSEIAQKYGNVRRDVFYDEQSRQYHYKYINGLLNDRLELSELRENLLNDLCSRTCALGRKV